MRKHTTELNRTIDIGSASKECNTRLFKRFLPKTVNANLEQPLFVPVLRHPFDVRETVHVLKVVLFRLFVFFGIQTRRAGHFLCGLA